MFKITTRLIQMRLLLRGKYHRRVLLCTMLGDISNRAYHKIVSSLLKFVKTKIYILNGLS